MMCVGPTSRRRRRRETRGYAAASKQQVGIAMTRGGRGMAREQTKEVESGEIVIKGGERRAERISVIIVPVHTATRGLCLAVSTMRMNMESSSLKNVVQVRINRPAVRVRNT